MLPPKIMIVEDEPGLLTLFSQILAPLQAELMPIEGGANALNVLATQTPDILILDLAMPDVNGQQVLQYVRNTPRLANTKVMISSARVTKPAVEELGYDSWVSKPILPQPFLEAVRALL